MKFLVAYASKYGATKEIAERIAAALRSAGHEVEAQPVKAIRSLGGYDAVVIGSAVYFGSWLKEAREFVQRNQGALARRPLWLFSSGPISTDTVDDVGRGMGEAAEPKQLVGFKQALKPRDHQVFFGKLDRGKLGFRDKLIAGMPAFPGSEGDFRDWAAVEAWAESIAHDPVSLSSRAE